MWKKMIRGNAFTLSIALICQLSFLSPSLAQNMQRVKGYCGLYFRSMEDLFRQKQAELDFYDCRSGQFIASIGARCGHWEAAYAATTDSIHFYLEDIDT